MKFKYIVSLSGYFKFEFSDSEMAASFAKTAKETYIKDNEEDYIKVTILIDKEDE